MKFSRRTDRISTERVNRPRRAKKQLRLHVEQLENRVQASSSILGLICGSLLADLISTDSDGKNRHPERLPADESGFYGASKAQPASAAIQTDATTDESGQLQTASRSDDAISEISQQQDSERYHQEKRKSGIDPEQGGSQWELLSAGVPAANMSAAEPSPPPASGIGIAAKPVAQNTSGSAGGAARNEPPAPVNTAPSGGSVVAPPKSSIAAGGGGPSVTLSDDVPEVEISADGQSILAAGSISSKEDWENLADDDPLEMKMTSCCGCGCPNTAPYIIGTQCGTGCTLAEVFLDFHGHDQNSQETDNKVKIILSNYFDDNEQASSTLQYSVDSNSNMSLVSATISGQELTLTALPLPTGTSPGISNVVVRATDDHNASATWSIKVYWVEVIGFQLEERTGPKTATMRRRTVAPIRLRPSGMCCGPATRIGGNQKCCQRRRQGISSSTNGRIACPGSQLPRGAMSQLIIPSGTAGLTVPPTRPPEVKLRFCHAFNLDRSIQTRC